MTAEWIPCGSSFIEADVVRWSEGVWEKPCRRPEGKSIHVGDRAVTAEVPRIDGGWVDLLVRDGKVVSEKSGWKVAPVATGTEVRRKRRTIKKGKPERLLWSDESVRALLVSRLPEADNSSPSEEADRK